MIEKLGGYQIYTTSLKKLRELALDHDEVQAGDVSRLEFDHDIDIALGTKILTQDRAEQGHTTDVMLSAECRDGVSVYWNLWTHESFMIP